MKISASNCRAIKKEEKKERKKEEKQKSLSVCPEEKVFSLHRKARLTNIEFRFMSLFLSWILRAKVSAQVYGAREKKKSK